MEFVSGFLLRVIDSFELLFVSSGWRRGGREIMWNS